MPTKKTPTLPEYLGVVDRAVVPVASLRHFPGNARTHDLPTIAESLRQNTLYRDIVARRHPDPEKDNTVLAGNGTLEAARDLLGWEFVSVAYVECDDDRALRINLVDNAANDKAGYDDTALLRQLQALEGDFAGSGHAQTDLDALVARLSEQAEVAAEIPFSPSLMERHDYVVLYFDNEMDWTQAQQVLGIGTVKAWDSKPGYERKGLGRLIPGAPVIRRLDGTH